MIYPVWELPNYPEKWARALEQFDEIWVPTRFVEDSIAKSVSKPVIRMPFACEPKVRSFIGREYFGIPASAFAFLFFFDFTSFIARKKPFTVVDAFERAMTKCGKSDTCLVLKLNPDSNGLRAVPIGIGKTRCSDHPSGQDLQR